MTEAHTLSDADRERLAQILDTHQSHGPGDYTHIATSIVDAVRHAVARLHYEHGRNYVKSRELAADLDASAGHVGQALSALSNEGVVAKWSGKQTTPVTWRIDP